MTFVRDFSMTTNRGLTVRLCGDFSYEAIGFDNKPLGHFEIDWVDSKGNKVTNKKAMEDLKEGKCRIGRFRGFYKITFKLISSAKMM